MLFKSALVRGLVLLSSVLFLSACGGGGGSSSGGNGSITLSPGSVSFTAEHNGNLPSNQYVSINLTDANTAGIIVGWPNESGFTQPSWLSLSPSDLTQNSSSTFTLGLRINTTSLSTGTYSTRVRIVAADSNGELIDYKDIPISYTVNPARLLSASPASLTFSEIEGLAVAGQDIQLTDSTGSIPAWSGSVVYSSGSNWLTLTPSADRSSIGIAVTPQLAGTYQATIRVSYTTNGTNKLLSIPVTYTSNSSASFSSSSLTFSSIEGSLTTAQNINITFAGATSPVWSATASYTSGAGWLSLTTTGNTIEVQPALIAEGTYQADIIISYETGLGISVKSIPVTYTVSSGVAVSTTSLNINSVEGEDPAAVDITFSLLSSAVLSSWNTTIIYSGASGWLSLSSTSGTGLPATISADVISKIPGTYTATIRLNYTLGTITGSIAVPVTYTVASGVSTSPTSMPFTTQEGKQPTAQSLSINYTGTATLPWTASVSYTGTTTGWLNLSAASGTTMPGSISVQPNVLPKGSYNASVNVQYTVDGVTTTKTTAVSYTVSTAWQIPTPQAINFTIDANTTLADLQQDITLGDTYTDASTIDWTAASEANWITASPASGDTDTNNIITVSLVEAELGNLASESAHNVVITPGNTDIEPISIPVTVTYNVPVISNVSPNVRFTNQPTEVILRGRGFNSITTENITFAGQAATVINIISDTEIHVSPPAGVFSTAGTYHVAMEGVAVIDVSSADLLVVDPPAYTTTSVTLSGIPRRMVHDPKRNALFYTTDAGIYKLTHSSATVWNETSAPLAKAFGIALLPDSSKLFVATYNEQLFPNVDPDTLALGNEVIYSTYYNFVDVAPMNNGKTVVTDGSAYGYLLFYPALTTSYLPSQYVFNIYSEDRNQVLFGGQSSQPVQVYNASTDTVSSVISGAPSRIEPKYSSISERGERTVIWKSVYDENFVYLGELDTTSLSSTSAISPDGSRLYAVNNNMLSTFDISGTTGPFPLVGTEVSFTTDTTFAPFGMVISQDGSTLFIYNTTTLYVHPLP